MSSHKHDQKANPKHKYPNKHQREATTKPSSQKIVRKRYNVRPQTAYHIQQLAFQEGVPEGKIIDKIMRTYLVSQRCELDRTNL